MGLQDRRVAECAKLGIEYIPADELQRREIEQQEKADLRAAKANAKGRRNR